MAEDIAKVGVGFDSAEAYRNLVKFAKKVKETCSDVELFDKFMDSLNETMYSVASGFGADNVVLKELTAEMKNLSSSVKSLDGNIGSLVQGGTSLYKSLNKTSEITRGVASSTDKASESMRKMTKSLNDSAAQANRFNTGNIAAQFQDIFVTAQMGMKPLTIAMQQGTQLVYILQQSKNPLKDLIAGVKSLVTPLSLVTVGLTGLLAIFVQTVDWVKVGKNILNSLAKGFDFVASHAKEFTTIIIGLGTVFMSTLLPSIMKTTHHLATLVYTLELGITRAVAFWAAFLGPISLLIGGLALANMGYEELIEKANDFNEKNEKSFGEKFIDSVRKTINYTIAGFKTMAEAVAAYYDYLGRNLGHALTAYLPDKVRDFLGINVVPSMSGEELSDNINNYWEKNASIDYIGKIIPSLEKGSKDASDFLKKTAEGLGENDKNAKKLEKTIEGLRKEYEDLAVSYQNKIDKSEFELSLMGLTEEEKLIKQINYDYDKEIEKLERKVALKKISLATFDEEKSKIEELKDKYEKIAIEEQRIETLRSVTKGFFSDMRKGLRDGESAWESFGNAVTNVLDKILDRIMDIGVDALFQAGRSAGWFSAGNATDIRPTFLQGTQALGGVWDNGVQKFAKGGIVTSPTIFAMRKGAGLMGEAGPEAVMPLRRGPDGSLGVKADGIGGTNVVVNVINNSNAQAKTEQRQTAQGTEIDVIIDEMVAEKLARPGTSSNSALRAFNNRQLITR